MLCYREAVGNENKQCQKEKKKKDKSQQNNGNDVNRRRDIHNLERSRYLICIAGRRQVEGLLGSPTPRLQATYGP